MTQTLAQTQHPATGEPGTAHYESSRPASSKSDHSENQGVALERGPFALTQRKQTLRKEARTCAQRKDHASNTSPVSTESSTPINSPEAFESSTQSGISPVLTSFSESHPSAASMGSNPRVDIKGGAISKSSEIQSQGPRQGIEATPERADGNQSFDANQLSNVTDPQERAVTMTVTDSTLECWDDKTYFGRKRAKTKLFVGRSRAFSFPGFLVNEWEQDIMPRLVNDLAAVSSWSSPDEFFEAELRMAGHTVRKEMVVCLKPTVCIRCTSKTCRKEFKKAVKDLDYLASFCAGRVEVRLGAPKLATSESKDELSMEDDDSEHSNISQDNTEQDQMIQIWKHGESACGLKMRTVSSTHDRPIESISTIGGLIKVDNQIFGLTTGHGIIAPSLAAPKKTPLSYSDSSTDESDLESLVDSDTDLEMEDTQDIRQSDAVHIPTVWKDLPFRGSACFGGRKKTTASLDDMSELKSVDFALIDMGFASSSYLTNTFKVFGESKAYVDNIRHDTELYSGPVLVIVDKDLPREGFLLEGVTLFRNKTSSFHTRKLELSAPLPKGVSGSWVIQDHHLCGIVIAVYETEPYLHMITVDRMFQDIQETLTTTYIGIAKKEDLEMAYMEPQPLNPGDPIDFEGKQSSLISSKAKRQVKFRSSTSHYNRTNRASVKALFAAPYQTPAVQVPNTQTSVGQATDQAPKVRQASRSTRDSTTIAHHNPTSSSREGQWIWSEEHGDYYKVQYDEAGRTMRYVWGRSTIPSPSPPHLSTIAAQNIQQPMQTSPRRTLATFQTPQASYGADPTYQYPHASYGAYSTRQTLPAVQARGGQVAYQTARPQASLASQYTYTSGFSSNQSSGGYTDRPPQSIPNQGYIAPQQPMRRDERNDSAYPPDTTDRRRF